VTHKRGGMLAQKRNGVQSVVVLLVLQPWLASSDLNCTFRGV